MSRPFQDFFYWFTIVPTVVENSLFFGYNLYVLIFNPKQPKVLIAKKFNKHKSGEILVKCGEGNIA